MKLSTMDKILDCIGLGATVLLVFAAAVIFVFVLARAAGWALLFLGPTLLVAYGIGWLFKKLTPP
jgi:hypothetical protein